MIDYGPPPIKNAKKCFSCFIKSFQVAKNGPFIHKPFIQPFFDHSYIKNLNEDKITTVSPYFSVRSDPPCSYLFRNPPTDEKSSFLSCQSLINPDKFPQLLSGNSRRKQNVTN